MIRLTERKIGIRFSYENRSAIFRSKSDSVFGFQIDPQFSFSNRNHDSDWKVDLDRSLSDFYFDIGSWFFRINHAAINIRFDALGGSAPAAWASPALWWRRITGQKYEKKRYHPIATVPRPPTRDWWHKRGEDMDD
jgi:hypothetical protein